MALAFRNVDVDPGAPIENWPYEAIVTVLERGGLDDWLPLLRAIEEDPWGPVARQIEEYLTYERPYGTAPLMERWIRDARHAAEEDARARVASHVASLIDESGLSAAEFADRLGTSPSRLSTYRTGRVSPSAALLFRMQDLADRHRRRSS